MGLDEELRRRIYRLALTMQQAALGRGGTSGDDALELEYVIAKLRASGRDHPRFARTDLWNFDDAELRQMCEALGQAANDPRLTLPEGDGRRRLVQRLDDAEVWKAIALISFFVIVGAACLCKHYLDLTGVRRMLDDGGRTQGHVVGDFGGRDDRYKGSPQMYGRKIEVIVEGELLRLRDHFAYSRKPFNAEIASRQAVSVVYQYGHPESARIEREARYDATHPWSGNFLVLGILALLVGLGFLYGTYRIQTE